MQTFVYQQNVGVLQTCRQWLTKQKKMFSFAFGYGLVNI